jgi:hypothetical protein
MMHSTRLFAPAAALVLSLASTVAFAQSGNFSGAYSAKTEDGTVTLTLNQASDGTVTGSMREEESVTELRGKVADGGKCVTGKILLQGQETPIEFEIRHESSGKLRFVMKVNGEEDEPIVFSSTGRAAPNDPKPAPTKPLAKKPEGAPLTVPTASAALGGGTFRHPTGLRLPLGQDWKAMTQGIVVLLPPGASKPDSSEGYLLLLTDNPDAVLQKLEGQFQAQLQRANISGRGFAYEGTANGAAVRVRCFVTPERGGVSAVLFANGTKEKMLKREPALQAMMNGATFAPPEFDSRLIGTWSGKLVDTARDVRGVGGRLEVSGATDSQTSYRLEPGGGFAELNRSRSIFIGQGVSIDTGDQVDRKDGRWYGGNGVICLSMGGVYVTGAYRFEGSRLIVELGNKALALQR